jgi:hypothetical protein
MIITKEIFDKLNRNVNELNLDIKHSEALTAAGITRIIEIYWLHWECFLRHKPFKGFGKTGLSDLEGRLKNIDLFILDESIDVIRAYDSFAWSEKPSLQPSAPKEAGLEPDQILRATLEAILQIHGKKHDSSTLDTIQRII